MTQECYLLSRVWTEGETRGLTKSMLRLLLPVPAGQGRDQGAALYM